MDDDAVEFAIVVFIQLLGIGAYGVQREEEVAREDVVDRIVEADVVGVVVVVEKLAVDLQDALVAAEDVVHLPHSLAVATGHTIYPRRHLRNIYCGKRNLINVIFYHIKLLTERNMRFHR